MKRNHLVPIVIMSFLVACESQSKEDTKAGISTPKKTEISVIPNKVITAEVTGMTCEKGCGGIIRKNLKATGAVAKVEFDFVEDAEKQVCRIFFDDKKISETKISEIVNSVNEEHYAMTLLRSEGLTKK